MTIRLFGNPDAVAIYDEAPGGGNIIDPASDMNRPFLHPEEWLESVYFHSDFDYYTLHSVSSVSVTHAAVSGLTQTSDKGFGTTPIISVGQTVKADQLLVSHDLPYVPRYMIAQNGRVLPNGLNVQPIPNQGRLVSFYATSSEIRVVNVGASSEFALPAITVTYDVIIFKNVSSSDDLPLLQLSPERVVMGQGKIDTDNRTMREGAGDDSPFFITFGKTIDIDKGSTMIILPNGASIRETGYAGLFIGSPFVRTYVDD